MNLKTVVEEIEEILFIKSLPKDQEYISPNDNHQNIVVMSMTHEQRLQTAGDRKLFRMAKIRK